MKTRSPAVKRLDVLVDEWSEEKQAFESPDGPTAKVTATETFEWLPDELFLLHRLDGNQSLSNSSTDSTDSAVNKTREPRD